MAGCMWRFVKACWFAAGRIIGKRTIRADQQTMGIIKAKTSPGCEHMKQGTSSFVLS